MRKIAAVTPTANNTLSAVLSSPAIDAAKPKHASERFNRFGMVWLRKSIQEMTAKWQANMAVEINMKCMTSRLVTAEGALLDDDAVCLADICVLALKHLSRREGEGKFEDAFAIGGINCDSTRVTGGNGRCQDVLNWRFR